MAVVEAHHERRATLDTSHLDDLTVAVGLPDMLAADDDSLTDNCLHRVLPRLCSAYARACGRASLLQT
jgi:hypothetical protein